MIRIVADSTCDLSQDLVEKYNIEIAPLHIVLSEKEYLDRVEISPDEIYRWSEQHGETPKTSAIGYDDAVQILSRLKREEEELIIFTISGKMSTTANVFGMVVQELELEDKVTIIDSCNLSTGIGLMVIKAALLVQEGLCRKEICEYIEKMKAQVRSSFVVDTLTYLHRGGRCSSVAALAGGMLKLHPKIVVADGAMSADKKYRGKINKAIMEYVKDLEVDLKLANKERVFITHSGCEQEIIDTVYAYLEKLNYFEEILITRAGGVISSHCGPGTLGVLFVAKES